MRRSCKRNEIRNPISGRCVKRSGKIGKEILRSRSRNRSRNRIGECQSQIRNPRTNRCVNRNGPIGNVLLESGVILENCAHRIMNPVTGRCVNKDSKLGQAILAEEARVGVLGNVIMDDIVYNRLGVNRRQPSPPRRVIQPIPEALPIQNRAPAVEITFADQSIIDKIILDLNKKTLKQLKTRAKRLGVSSSGKKKDIIMRLANNVLIRNRYYPMISSYNEW